MPENARKKLPNTILSEREENELITSKLAHLNVRSDPVYLRAVTVQGTGLFQCGKCSRIWSSHHSCVKVDLVNFCLLDDTMNRQGCIKCHKSLSITQWPTPCFKECWFEKILDKVVTKYNMRQVCNGQRLSDNNGGHIAGGSPHRQDLCERCIKSGSPCWESV